MKITRFFFIAILPQISLFFAISAATLSNPKEQATKIPFKENKNQVYDQNYKPRTDILFSETDDRLVCHFKSRGDLFLKIYPNNRIITIESEILNNNSIEVEILNTLRQVLVNETITKQHITLDLQILANGIYYVVAHCNEQIIKQKNIVAR